MERDGQKRDLQNPRILLDVGFLHGLLFFSSFLTLASSVRSVRHLSSTVPTQYSTSLRRDTGREMEFLSSNNLSGDLIEMEHFHDRIVHRIFVIDIRFYLFRCPSKDLCNGVSPEHTHLTPYLVTVAL